MDVDRYKVKKKKTRRGKKHSSERIMEAMDNVLKNKYLLFVVIIVLAWFVGRWILRYTMN